MQNSEECTLCDPGYACDMTGLAAPATVCAAGFYCKNENASASSATPICLDSSCEGNYGICPAGYSCQNKTIQPELCSPGRYAPTDGLESCLKCEKGIIRSFRKDAFRCPGPAGQFCNGTHTHKYFVCPHRCCPNDVHARNHTPQVLVATIALWELALFLHDVLLGGMGMPQSYDQNSSAPCVQPECSVS